jgi:hypothetical protein
MNWKARWIAGALGTIALGLGATEVAQGRATKVSVRVSGTQTTQAHVVDKGCSDQGPVTGDQSETHTFTTYRPLIMVVTHSRRIGFDLGYTRTNQNALTKGSIDRNSTLNANGDPVQCSSNSAPAVCGTKAFSRLPLQVGPVLAGNRFKGVAIHNGITTPRDPFPQCNGPGQSFPEVLDRPSNNSLRFFYAPISASFLKGCSRATQSRTGTGTAQVDDPDATGTVAIRFKVSVTRLRCL